MSDEIGRSPGLPLVSLVAASAVVHGPAIVEVLARGDLEVPVLDAVVELGGDPHPLGTAAEVAADSGQIAHGIALRSHLDLFAVGVRCLQAEAIFRAPELRQLTRPGLAGEV